MRGRGSVVCRRAGALTHPSKTRCIGILTAGGDCPGLNAAIRGVAKSAITEYGIKVIGILDGFRGLIENRTILLDEKAVSGILTRGGTILGTSRDKPHKLDMGGKVVDMSGVAADNARRLGIDCLVCLGGGGTQKSALHLAQAGIRVITLPKTIDNDVAQTDVSFGFDTAMSIATEAIDRLHTTATSHNRLIVCEVMGHSAGWLALGAGTAGGADVVLIPEIPYDLSVVAEHLKERRRNGKRFSIIVVAEAARAKGDEFPKAHEENGKRGSKKRGDSDKCDSANPNKDGECSAGTVDMCKHFHRVRESVASRLARQLQQLTDTEARVTSLGHVQRGGTPTAADRLLCTRLGMTATELLAKGHYNVMVAIQGGSCVPVPLDKVTGKKKTIPDGHPWLETARSVETCLGEMR